MSRMAIFITAIAIIVSFSICEIEIPDKNFNSKNLIKGISLPPELPVLIKKLNPIYADKKKIIKNLKGIIGFLPPSEQILLLDSFIDNDNGVNTALFDNTKYGDVLNTNDFFEDQIKSLSEVLSANAKRFRAGLGCIQKVTDYFKRRSREDELIVQNIYTMIQKLLEASNQLNHCEMNFMKVLYTTINKRKALLTEITKANYVYNTATDKTLFTYEDGKIKGINYSEADVNAIVNEFRNYATCHQAFNNAVHTKGMEIMISITQMKNCLDEDKPNKQAGKSSREYKNPSINYHGDESIGINNAEGIRTDRRTQNNYFLDHAYRYGQINGNLNSNNDVPVMEIPIEWAAKLNILLESSKTTGYKLVGLVSKLEGRQIGDRPFADLGNFLISTLSQTPNAALPFLAKSVSCTSSTPFAFECDSTNCKVGIGSIPSEFETFKFEAISYNNHYGTTHDSHGKSYNFNFFFYEPYLAVICDGGKFKIYAEGTDLILGKVYDYIESGISLGSVMGNIHQSCFGVFSSGGKNDKDACRDAINKECGSEIDYRCKESGLYDIITQNPPAKTILPEECLIENSGLNEYKCFNWIANHFILGSVSIRPSAFLSYSLIAQNHANKGELSVKNKYFTAITGYATYPSPSTKIDEFNALVISSSSFYVEDNRPGKFTLDGKLMGQVDRTAFIQTATAGNIHISFLIILSCSLMIIFS